MPPVAALESAPTRVAPDHAPAPLQSGDVAATLSALRDALHAHLAHADHSVTATALREASQHAAEAIAGLPKRDPHSTLAKAARDLAREFVASGVVHPRVTASDLATVRALISRGWPGALGAMLLMPSWQWPDAPALDAVPDWLWGDYAAWLFTPPARFDAPGQSEAYAAHFVRHLERLSQWAGRNYGSIAVQAALASYLNVASFQPLYLSRDPLRRHAELHAQLLGRVSRSSASGECALLPRAGRRLRIGVLVREGDTDPVTSPAPALFKHLDPQRFETVLFCLAEPALALSDPTLAAAQFLPESLAGQINELRAANLDVAVFASDVAGAADPYARLATQRFAPLQVVTSSSLITSGLASADLFVTGALTGLDPAADAAEFTERLAVIPGPARVFQAPVNTADDAAPAEPTRADFGLGADSLALVSVAHLRQITPEVQQTWARILQILPAARLVIQPLSSTEEPADAAASFTAAFHGLLQSHGLTPSRVVVLPNTISSYDDLRPLMAVGDIYLEPFELGEADLLMLPLAAGLPVVTWKGATLRSRLGASTLRSLDLDECVAHDEASYCRIVQRLAKDDTGRQALRQRIAESMQRTPAFLDPLACADAFGACLEAAFDRLAQLGRTAFLRERAPLLAPLDATARATQLEAARALLEVGQADGAIEQILPVLASSPTDPTVRHLYGQALLAQGNAERAAAYLMAAIERAEADQTLWLDLAVALHRGGRQAEATQALETCIRIDTNRLEPWLLLGEWAQECSHAEMLQEVLQVVQSLAPEDPRVTEFVARCA